MKYDASTGAVAYGACCPKKTGNLAIEVAIGVTAAECEYELAGKFAASASIGWDMGVLTLVIPFSGEPVYTMFGSGFTLGAVVAKHDAVGAASGVSDEGSKFACEGLLTFEDGKLGTDFKSLIPDLDAVGVGIGINLEPPEGGGWGLGIKPIVPGWWPDWLGLGIGLGDHCAGGYGCGADPHNQDVEAKRGKVDGIQTGMGMFGGVALGFDMVSCGL